MFNTTAHLCGAVFGVRAPEIDVALFGRGEHRTALWATGRHDPFALSTVPQLDDGTEDFRNDVAGLAQNNRVAEQHALLNDDVLVMERRLTHDRTSDRDRLHHCIGCRPTGSTDPNDDVEQYRVDLLGRILVGNGPARRAGGRPKPVVEFEIVDLHHDAIDLVLEVVAVLTVSLDVGNRPAGIGHHRPIWRRRHSPRRQQIIDFRLVRDRRVLPRADPVNVKAQALQPIPHEFELAFVLRLRFLAKAPRRGIAWVRKSLLAE